MRRKDTKLVLLVGIVVVTAAIAYGILSYKSKPVMKEPFVDRFGNNIDVTKVEHVEQAQAKKYIDPNASVLELGARYGTVSAVINGVLKRKTDHIAVEPDEQVWSALEKNKESSNSKFQVLKGFISNQKLGLQREGGDGYGNTQVADDSSKIPNFSFEAIRKMVSKPFTTLVADCEGCIEPFLDENEAILQTLDTVIMEEDQPHKCNYGKVQGLLQKYNFKVVERGFDEVYRSVWKK